MNKQEDFDLRAGDLVNAGDDFIGHVTGEVAVNVDSADQVELDDDENGEEQSVASFRDEVQISMASMGQETFVERKIFKYELCLDDETLDQEWKDAVYPYASHLCKDQITQFHSKNMKVNRKMDIMMEADPDHQYKCPYDQGQCPRCIRRDKVMDHLKNSNQPTSGKAHGDAKAKTAGLTRISLRDRHKESKASLN